MMKIAVIAPTEIPSRRANTLQVMKMAQALAGQGHSVQVAVPSSSSGGRERLESERSWEALTHHYGLSQRFDLVWMKSHPRLKRYDFGWRAVRWARRWQADLIYTRLPQAAAFASRFGLATLFEVHDLPQGRMGPWLFRQFLRGGGSRRLVSITRALLDDLLRIFHLDLDPSFAVIAPDGVDLERYQALPDPPLARQALSQSAALQQLSRLKPERFCAGYTGHLYPGRGRQILFELAAQLPDVDFLVVGGEPEHVEPFQSQALYAGLENLILTGFIPNADLPLYQAACDILLMPYQQQVEASSGGDISRYLSPMKLFEYLACGRAIISSSLPVLLEVLNDQNSVLLPVDQPAAWVETVQHLLDHPELRDQLSASARRDAQLYTWEMRAKKILQGL